MSTPPAGGAPAEPGAPPTPHHCYRHPDRETGVSCTRCGRYICPDCMRPAAVGFQCPEEDGAAPARRPAAGARAGGARARAGSVLPGRPGLVTQLLIGLCVLAYVFQGVPGLGTNDRLNSFTTRFDLSGGQIVYHHEYYRLLTAAFLHANLLHILFNMWALYVIGYPLEQVLGRVRYLALFVVCAVGGSTLSFLVNGVGVESLGASTAIFGFFAAFYLIARRRRIDTTQILVLVGINLVITFALPDIDKWGHVGGLVTGAVLGWVYAYLPPRQVWLQAAATVVIGVLLVGATVVRAHQLEDRQPAGIFVGQRAPVAAAPAAAFSAVRPP